MTSIHHSNDMLGLYVPQDGMSVHAKHYTIISQVGVL